MARLFTPVAHKFERAGSRLAQADQYIDAKKKLGKRSPGGQGNQQDGRRTEERETGVAAVRNPVVQNRAVLHCHAGGIDITGNAPGPGVVLPDQQWSQKRGLTPVARLVSFGIAAVFAFMAYASPAFSHEHPKDNPDRHFLDRLERPDNADNPSRNTLGTFNSRLCCTDQDAVKVDYEMVVPEGGKYPEPEWYVWIDLDGKGAKRVRVPPEKIVEGYAPTGQAYAFVLGQTIQCFVRPQPRI